MTTADRNHREHARRFNEEVWGRYNFDALDDLVDEEFVGHNPSLPEPLHGADDVRETAEMLHAAFPDIEVDIEQVVAEDDWIAQRLTATATHEGEILGIQPTGTRIEFEGMNISRLADGKWVEGYELWDMLGLLQQLGAVDLPGE